MAQRAVAKLTDLEWVQLELELHRRMALLERVRQELAAEEVGQQALQRQIDERIGTLRREVDHIQAEVAVLESRLRRLLRADRPLSDAELSAQERAQRSTNGAEEAEGEVRFGRLLSSPNGHDDGILRQLYRSLARLIHPDLARDEHERAQREALMRLVNQAREAGDVDQLRRLLAIWSRGDQEERPRDLESLRTRVAQLGVELSTLERQLAALRQSDLGRLRARGPAALERYLAQQEQLLRQELAHQRMRRRRVLRLIEERRRELEHRAQVEQSASSEKRS